MSQLMAPCSRCSTAQQDSRRQAPLAGPQSAWRALLKRQIALSFLAVAALVSTGCHNPFKCFQYRHTSYDFVGEPNTAYYYYPKGGWAIPGRQSHHCPTTVEAPFHGFAATCWTQWPEPWDPCPPPGMHPPGFPGEIIETPHDAIQAPAMSPETQAMPVPVTPLIPPNQGARELPRLPLAGQHKPTPASKPPAAAAPSMDEEDSASPTPLASTAPALATPVVIAKPELAAPPKQTTLVFRGQHGFSAAEPAESSSAVVVELPIRKVSTDEPAQSKQSAESAKQLRSYVQPAK